MTHDDIASWIGRAKGAGLSGFGGDCGQAAIAINRVIFNGQGQLIGGLNDAFLDHNQLVGHIAVSCDDVVWDADGRPKDEVELEAWGMLDYDDPDYRDQAVALGICWSPETASRACIFDFFDDKLICDQFGTDRLDDFIAILEACRLTG